MHPESLHMQNLEFKTGVLKPVEIYKETWELMKGEFWPIFGITIVGILVGSVIPVVIIGPMMCGVYMCLLDKVDGRPAKFDKLFKGFDHFLPGLIVALVIMVPTLFFIAVIYVPMIGMAMAGPRMNESELMTFIIGMLVVEIIVALVMIVIHSLIIFAFPLIVDRKLGGLQASILSAKAVWANFKGVAGLFGLGILVCMAGYLLFCIGVYLAIPIIIMATTVAYRKIFPALALSHLEPPPPNAYSGLQ